MAMASKQSATPATRKSTRNIRGSSVSEGNEGAGDEESSQSSTSSAYTTASGKKRTKLPRWVQKQLLQDINNAGGLYDFDLGKPQGLAELLDHRSITLKQPQFYGLRASSQRRKVRNKVQKWKEWPEAKFLKKQRDLQVTQSTAPKTPKPVPFGSPGAKPSPVIEEAENESSPPIKVITIAEQKKRPAPAPAPTPAPVSRRTMVQHGTSWFV